MSISQDVGEVFGIGSADTGNKMEKFGAFGKEGWTKLGLGSHLRSRPHLFHEPFHVHLAHTASHALDGLLHGLMGLEELSNDFRSCSTP